MAMDIFPLGRPAGPEDIVDREGFITEVVQRLADGQSVMLAGPRRIGKSSVAGEVLRRLQAEKVHTASVDLFYVTGTEELAAKILAAVLANRTGVQVPAIKVYGSLKSLLAGSEFRAKIHDLELGLLLGGDKPNPADLLEISLKAAERLAKHDKRRMVILWDEFQEIERLGPEVSLQRLRALFQTQEQVSHLFLGSQPSLLRTIFADRHQAFYRFATLLELPPIPAAAWEEFLKRRLGEHGLKASRPGLELLLEQTGGHPYGVMAVAYEAYLQAKLASLGEITADIVHYAYERTLEHLDSVYSGQWEETRRFRHSDAILAALIEGRPPYSLPLTGGKVTRALKQLIELSLIKKGGRRGEYSLVEPMFGDWYRHRG